MRLVKSLLLLCALLVVCPRGTACAGDEKQSKARPSAAAVAAQFLKAEAAKDEARLQQLADSDNPDPWLVAEALDRMGEREAARRFTARLVRKGEDVAALPKYLAGAPDLDAQKDARAALDAALSAGSPEAALKELVAWRGEARTIAAVRISYQRGEARLGLAGENHAACRAAFEQAAELALEIRWLSRASLALAQAGRAAYLDGEWALAEGYFKTRMKVEERLASDMGRGRTSYGLYLTESKQAGSSPASQHDLEKTRRRLETARDLTRATDDREFEAKILGRDAEALLGKREYRGALVKFEQALKALAAISDQELPARFVSNPRWILRMRLYWLLLSASLARVLDGADKAQTYEEEAVRAAQEGGGAGLPTWAQAFLALLKGTELERDDRNEEAATEFEQARDLYAAMKPAQPTRLAYAMRRLAETRYRSRRFLEALELAEGALEILRIANSAESLTETLILCGRVHLRTGDAEAAWGLLDKAIKRASTAKDARLESHALIAMAEYHQRRAEYGRALDGLARARKACKACPDTDVPGVLLLRESQVRWSVEEPKMALAAAEAAVKALESGKEAHSLRLAREHFARLLAHDGRFDEAHAILQQLLEAHRQRDRAIGVAGVLDAMADLRFLQGRAEDDASAREKHFAAAHRLRVDALKGFKKSGDLPRTIIARSQVGRDLVWAGEDATGLHELREAERQAKALESRSTEAACALGLAEAFHKLRRWDDAIRSAERGLHLARDYGLDLAEGEGEQMRAGLLSLFHLGAEAALGADDASVLYRFFDRGRSAVLLAALGGREALATARVGPDLLLKKEQARAKAAEAREAAGRLGRNALSRKRNDAYKAVTAAEDEVRKAVMAIRSDVRMQADLAYPDPASLNEVLGCLSPGDALILYGEVSGYLFAVVVSKTEVQVKTKTGVRLETTKEVRLVRLGRAEPVRTAVQALLADEEDDEEVGDEKHVTPALAGQVRQLILAPLALGKDVERLLISPHGILSYVPFSLLDESREICFLPSGTVLATLRDQQVSDLRGQNVLALGDPDYGNRDGKRGTRKLMRLPATRAEVKGIADTKRGDEVLLDAGASETGFRAALASGKRWRSVHLACHGKVDREHPRRSLLALAASKEDPDGELQALEVFNMRVPSDLVVLSGCETGGGAVIEGEGLEGLTRAFMFAGAPRVIASLWNVEDEATRALMLKFYELWNPQPKPGDPERPKGVEGPSSLGAAAALRQAQQFVRTHPDHPEWKHPTYWAAWVLWGLPD